MSNILSLFIEHLLISAFGVLVAILVGVITGIIISRKRKIARIVLAIADVIQTIPSLALFAILMIFFGLGNKSLIIGLALYSLLPIIRNTYIGILGIDKAITEAAKGMGMSNMQSLIKIELPLAMPIIFSGIKIAFVTSLGITVIGVLIGAGGLGKLIYRGIQSLNINMIISGAIPVCLSSIVFEYLFNMLEKKLIRQ